MKKIFPFIVLLTSLAGCSPEIRVRADYDPDYDLWAFKTFDWGKKTSIEDSKSPLIYNELNDKRIKSAALTELNARGFQLSESNPDLFFHYHIIVEEKSVLTPERTNYNYSQYWLRMEAHTYTYKEGTLILDLMDAKTRNLVWRGWAVTDINDSYDPDEIDALTKKVVARIFKQFPKRSLTPQKQSTSSDE